MIIHSADVKLAWPPVTTRTKPDWDLTIGCGTAERPAAFGQVATGRVCAGTGAVLSCKLCPNSPTYEGVSRA